MRPRSRTIELVAAVTIGACLRVCLAEKGQTQADRLPDFNFVLRQEAEEWAATHDIERLEWGEEGLRIRIGGSDPYITGPVRDFPVERLLWMRVRLKSDRGGIAQVFYFTTAATERNSVRFAVRAGEWEEVRVPMPALGPGVRLRIDPPGADGVCVVGRLGFEERPVYAPARWPTAEFSGGGADWKSVAAGDLTVRHDPRRLGGFEVEVAGRVMAKGSVRQRIGYAMGGEARWLELERHSSGVVDVQAGADGIKITGSFEDPEGARWRVRQSFSVASRGVVRVSSEWSADRDREVLHLPLITLFAGIGEFGTNKNQGLFAGVEYLEDEPSSSEADVIGPGSWRLAPDAVKITFPLMAIQADRRYVGLIWEPRDRAGAIFDSPDRQFGSGGHLMGLVFPGSDGLIREERSLMPHGPVRLEAGRRIRSRVQLIGGRGETVVEAVKRYVELEGMPPLPRRVVGAREYYELAARGWLDSRIRQGDLFRHAFWPGFDPQRAADAPLWMLWLASRLGSGETTDRLRDTAAGVRAGLPGEDLNGLQIGHVRTPAPALVFGGVLANADAARARAVALQRRFEADGTVRYGRREGGMDYGRTHWERHANGLTAGVVAELFEAALFSGDGRLLGEAVSKLEGLNRYRGGVPRGAQTWEVPLHTPDILAAANLVRAYMMGYEQTGEPDFLEQARYWAWTGVPFVYLQSPTASAVGVFNTIAVLGATSWEAPLWLGRPVQWCGLVYSHALYQLAEHDSGGPWRRIADGITAAGVQHTWPASDLERQGLLPDFFELRAQRREGPAINPGTLLASAARYYGAEGPYSMKVFRGKRWIVHAAGAIRDAEENEEGIRFRVGLWSFEPSWILVNGLTREPRIRVGGQARAIDGERVQFDRDLGRCVVRVEGTCVMEIWQ